MKSKQPGFTLIELLIYITLVAGIVITATSFIWKVIDSRSKAFAMQAVEQNGQFITTKMAQLIRSGMAIDYPAVGQSDQRLDVVISTNPTIVIGFELIDGSLVFNDGSGSTAILNSNQVVIDNVTFQNISSSDDESRQVLFSMTISHYNPSDQPARRFTDTFSTAWELHNHN